MTQNNTKHMINKVSILLIAFAWSFSLKGQQAPLFTQYDQNKLFINPAAAGVGGYTSISLIAREQWVGFKGTPKTHAVSIDSRILGNSFIFKKMSVRKKKPQKTKSGNTGWGATLYSDLNGPMDRTGMNATYSYHLDMGSSQLSFGLSFMFSQLRIQAEQFIWSDDRTDDLRFGNNKSLWLIDANFGVLYTTQNYFAGYSTMQLLNSSAQFGTDNIGDFKQERMHNLMGGYTFYVNDRIDITPTALIKIPEQSAMQLDLSAKATYEGLYWGGLAFRTGSALSIFGGLNIDRYYFGYAFDYNFGTIHTSNFGSHEFIATMRIGNARRYKWLNTY